MVARATSRFSIDAIEPQTAKIELIDEGFDDTNWVVGPNEVIETFRQQGDLTSVLANDESPHAGPRKRVVELKPIDTRLDTASA